MVKWEVGDLLVSDVTQRATVYEVAATKMVDGRQEVSLTIGGHAFGGSYSSTLFELWMPLMDDTRGYLDVVTNYAERTENEVS